MGKISHTTPLSFAEDLRAYLWAQIEPQGADRSGRWLESATGKARSRDYWRKVTNGDQAMTTNDIQVLAERLFDQTPYEFVRAVREWALPDATVHYPEFDTGAGNEQTDAARRAARRRSRNRGEENHD